MIRPTLAALLLLSPVLLRSETPAKLEIRHKSRDLEKVKEELERKKNETERLKKEAEELTADLKRAETKINSIEQSLNNTKTRNVEVERKLANTKNEHDRLVQDIGENKNRLGQAYKSYYVASALMGPTSSVPVISRQILHDRSVDYSHMKKRRVLKESELSDLTDANMALRTELDRQRATLTEVRDGVTSKEKLLERKLTRRQAVESELRDLQQTAEELASLIDILRSKAKKEADADRKARMAKQQSGHSPIARNSLTWPAVGTVSEKFGRQVHPELKTPYNSNGIVISMKTSAPVIAVSDGTVLYSGNFMSYGPMVLVEHPGDWYTVYGRLTRWNVEKGQRVLKGESVGTPGISAKGRPETYFELRFYGKPIDPLPWLSD